MAGEALVDVFTSISQKRKHGILRLVAAGATYELSFFDGKVIDVSQSAGTDARDICSRLVKAGLIHDKVYQLVQSKPVTVVQLFDLLVSKKFVSAVDFQRAKRAHDLDLMHLLGFAEDAVFDFRPRDMRPDPRFPQSVSPSQLLLDFCELQADEERYQSVFGTKGVPITRRPAEPKGLCDFERAVWQILEKVRHTAELFHGLLSEFEVKEGLLALLDRGFINVGNPGERNETSLPRAASEHIEDDLLNLAEVDSNDLFGKIADAAVGSILDGFEDKITLNELADAVLDVPVQTKAPAVLTAGRSEAPAQPAPQATSAAPSEPSTPAADSAPVKSGNASAAPEVEKPAKQNFIAEKSLGDLVVQFLQCTAQKGFKAAVFEMNHLFLERKVLEPISLVTVLAYLVLLTIFCLTGTGLIEPWFLALSEFTSAA